MILKNKKLLIFTSALTLLPLPLFFLLKSRFPGEFVESFSLMFWLPPLSLLAGQWLCVFFTSLDKSNRDRNEKVQKLVLWIIPLISNLLCGIFFALLLGLEISPSAWMGAAMGLLFVLIGNYMPKTRMNATIGIKVKWAYTSEENWNATHRFAGRLWVTGGLVLIPMSFLPGESAVAILLVITLLVALVPMWYSWNFYRKEKAQGKPLKDGFPTENKKVAKASLVFLALILIFCGFVLWSGDLQYRLGEESFTVEADWYADLTLRYDAIESIEYRQGDVPGTRTGGWGSFRLLLGFFSNEEFGLHTRYTYYKPESCIVLTTKSRAVVLSCETAPETQALYQSLRQITGK